jgi:hypothetical protein
LIVVYFLFIETRGSSLEEISMMTGGAEIEEKMIENVAHATAPIPSALEKTGTGEAINIERIEDEV